VPATLLLLSSPQGSYESYDSPPKLVDPFRNYWTKAFRMEWWRQQLAFLRDSSHELAVDAAYVWPAGSWDVAAIYHASSKGAAQHACGCVQSIIPSCKQTQIPKKFTWSVCSRLPRQQQGAGRAAASAGACSCVLSPSP
jgi:hypothetical protein